MGLHLEIQIYEVEGLHFMYSVYKGADQQCCHRTADLHLCFRTHLKQDFSWRDSLSTIPTLLSPIILSFNEFEGKDVELKKIYFFNHLFIHLFVFFIY